MQFFKGCGIFYPRVKNDHRVTRFPLAEKVVPEQNRGFNAEKGGATALSQRDNIGAVECHKMCNYQTKRKILKYF